MIRSLITCLLALSLLSDYATAADLPQATSIAITPEYVVLRQGETVQLKATVLPEEASQTVKWEADYSGEYTIDDEGNLTATFTSDDINTGLFVTATTTDGSNLSAHCPIAKKYSEPESLEILQPEITVRQGETATFTARLLPEDGIYESIRWYANNRYIGEGNTLDYYASNIYSPIVITAEYLLSDYTFEEPENDEPIEYPARILTAECVLNVIEPLAKIMTLYPSKLTLRPGVSVQLTALTDPYPHDRACIWESSDPNIVTVNESGEISTVADGNATVTATTSDGSGIRRTCAVTVSSNTTEQKPNTLRISLNNGSDKDIPLSRIESIHYSENSNGTVEIRIPDESMVSIPFNEIKGITHIYDSANGIAGTTGSDISITTVGSTLIVEGCPDTPALAVYGLNGQQIYHGQSSSIELEPGIYIVIVNSSTIFKTRI